MHRAPFASGSYSTAHAGGAGVCYVRTPLDPSQYYTLGNAVAAVGTADSLGDVFLSVPAAAAVDAPREPEDHPPLPAVIVRQPRGEVLEGLPARPFIDPGSPTPLWPLRALLRDVLRVCACAAPAPAPPPLQPRRAQQLAVAHAAGRVHSDVKPGNIVLLPSSGGGGTRRGRPHFALIDGGSWLDGALLPAIPYEPQNVTTAAFRAPWLVEGPDDVGVAVAAGDVWSLGLSVLVLAAGTCFCAPADVRSAARQAAFLRELLALRRPLAERRAALTRLVPWLSLEPSLVDLLARMLGPADTETLTAAAALRHIAFDITRRTPPLLPSQQLRPASDASPARPSEVTPAPLLTLPARSPTPARASKRSRQEA